MVASILQAGSPGRTTVGSESPRTRSQGCEVVTLVHETALTMKGEQPWLTERNADMKTASGWQVPARMSVQPVVLVTATGTARALHAD